MSAARAALDRRAISRRRFIQQAAATAAASAIVSLDTPPASAGEEHMPASRPSLPIIDTHQHLWDLDKLRLPWLQGAGEPLERSYLTKDYLDATAGLNVVQSVYMEVDVAPDCKLAEAHYVLDICRRRDTPMAAAVIGGRPAADDFRQYITQFKDSPHIKGIRQIVPNAELFADPNFRRGIHLLGQLGMCFDLCHSPQLLPDAARLIDACPDTRFILDHCGNAQVKWFVPPLQDEAPANRWRHDIASLAQRKHVVCKISGIIATATRDQWRPEHLAPIVNHCIDTFGPERVMFAGDWPVCTRVASFHQWVEALKQIVGSRSLIDQRKLFHDNAQRFYRLRHIDTINKPDAAG